MSDPPRSPPASRTAFRFWRTLLRLNRGYGGANQAAHGALRFGSFVKLVGWLGLLGIVFLLLHKMKEIQQELDPVTSSLDALQGELRQAQRSVGKGTEASTEELQRLQQRAAELDRTLGKTTEEHLTKGVENLSHADTASEALAHQVEADALRLHELEAQTAQIAATLEGQSKALAANQQLLDAQAKLLADNQRALTAQGQALATQTAALLDGGAAALSALGTLRQSSAATEAQLRGQAATAALSTLAETSKQLEHALKQRNESAPAAEARGVPPPSPSASE